MCCVASARSSACAHGYRPVSQDCALTTSVARKQLEGWELREGGMVGAVRGGGSGRSGRSSARGTGHALGTCLDLLGPVVPQQGYNPSGRTRGTDTGNLSCRKGTAGPSHRKAGLARKWVCEVNQLTPVCDAYSAFHDLLLHMTPLLGPSEFSSLKSGQSREARMSASARSLAAGARLLLPQTSIVRNAPSQFEHSASPLLLPSRAGFFRPDARTSARPSWLTGPASLWSSASSPNGR